MVSVIDITSDIVPVIKVLNIPWIDNTELLITGNAWEINPSIWVPWLVYREDDACCVVDSLLPNREPNISASNDFPDCSPPAILLIILVPTPENNPN